MFPKHEVFSVHSPKTEAQGKLGMLTANNTAAAAVAAAKSRQSCPTLSDPMDCSLRGASVHGISQAYAGSLVAVCGV